VYFYDEAACLRSIPAAWTSVTSPDPIITAAAGRSAFRFDDLVDLAHLLDGLAHDV